MTKSPFFAAIAAIVLCGLLISAVIAWQNPGYNYGQQNGRQPVRQPVRTAQPQTMPPVALIDVGRILEQNSRLKAEKQSLIAEMKQADEKLVERQKAIRSLQMQLRDLRAGTQKYKDLEAEIARRMSQLEVDAKLQQKTFSEKRSRLLYQAYTEIEQEVQSVSMERGFVMVLRFSGENPPQDQLQAVYAYAGKPVVWFNQGLDITNLVLDRLERRAAYGNNGNSNISNAQSRPGVPGPPTRR